MFRQTYPGGENGTLTPWVRGTPAWQLSTMAHIPADTTLIQTVQISMAVTLARSYQKINPTDTRVQFIRG